MTTPNDDQAIQVIDAETRELALTARSGGIMAAFTPRQAEVVRNVLIPEANNDELEMFLTICQHNGLDPFRREIWGWMQQGRLITQTSIDGLRGIAQRTGEFEGVDGPWWCGPDGEWVGVWLQDEPPTAAKVIVRRRGRVPRPSIALYRESVQRGQGGGPNAMWSRRPAAQLLKCAEALGLRQEFPNELAGIYSDAELDRRDPERGERSAQQPAPDQARGGRPGTPVSRAGGAASTRASSATAARPPPAREPEEPARVPADPGAIPAISNNGELLAWARDRFGWNTDQLLDFCRRAGVEITLITELRGLVVGQYFQGDYRALAAVIAEHKETGEWPQFTRPQADPPEAGDQPALELGGE